MSKHDQAAYEHYVALCISQGLAPLSFSGWQQITAGEVPKELHKEDTHDNHIQP